MTLARFRGVKGDMITKELIRRCFTGMAEANALSFHLC